MRLASDSELESQRGPGGRGPDASAAASAPSLACAVPQLRGRPRRLVSKMAEFPDTEISKEQFQRDGFLLVPNIIPQETVALLRSRFEPLFAGDFDTVLFIVCVVSGGM